MPETYSYGRTLRVLWGAPAAMGYALVGGLLSVATLYALFAAFPLVVWGVGYDLVDVAAGTRLRSLPALLLTFAYAGAMLVAVRCVWAPFAAAVAHAVGSRRRGAECSGTVAAIAAAWRPVLAWAILGALATGFVARLFPPIARAVRVRLVPPGSDLAWRETTAFLGPALVLDRPATLEDALAESHRRATAVGRVPRRFLAGVALGCVLALATMTAFLVAYVSTSAAVFAVLAAYGAIASVLLGIVGAATLDVVRRTCLYVDLDDVGADERTTGRVRGRRAGPARVE